MNPGDLAPQLARHQDAWERLMDEAHVPGFSLALLHQDGAVDLVALGVRDAETRDPIQPTTVFEAASLSKPLFAYGVLKLAHQRLLDLDMPLAGYAPNHVPGTDPRLRRITPRMVLRHTTGLPNWRRDGRELRLRRRPGSGFGYSGEAYHWLQRTVEHVIGESIENYLQREVIGPLGMSASSYVWRENYEQTAATGHTSTGATYPKNKPAVANVACSLHTTAGDYARFMSLMLGVDGLGTKESSAAVAAMASPEIEISDSIAWGLGWGLYRDGEYRYLWHWGDNPGFKSFVAARQSDKSAAVFLANGNNGLAVFRPIVEEALGPVAHCLDWLETSFYA